MRRFFATSAGLAAGLVVSLVLVTPGGSNVASDISEPAEQRSVAAPAEPQPVAAAAPQAATPSSGVPTEGIKVHGHWVIEVRNPDGTLADRREFENALVGGQHLAALLGRANSVGKWAVVLGSVASVGPCGSTPGLFGVTLPESCIVTEAASGYPSNDTIFETLTVTTPTEGANAGKLVLSGTATALANATVNIVNTSLSLCDPATPATTPCAIGGVFSSLNILIHHGVGITSTSLSSPVSVTSGQQIQVTVVISFQ